MYLTLYTVITIFDRLFATLLHLGGISGCQLLFAGLRPFFRFTSLSKQPYCLDLSLQTGMDPFFWGDLTETFQRAFGGPEVDSEKETVERSRGKMAAKKEVFSISSLVSFSSTNFGTTKWTILLLSNFGSSSAWV